MKNQQAQNEMKRSKSKFRATKYFCELREREYLRSDWRERKGTSKCDEFDFILNEKNNGWVFVRIAFHNSYFILRSMEMELSSIVNEWTRGSSPCMKILWALFLDFKLTKWAQFYTAFHFYFIFLLHFIGKINGRYRAFARIVCYEEFCWSDGSAETYDILLSMSYDSYIRKYSFLNLLNN